MATKKRWRIKWPKFTRDGILFFSGLAGLLHETVIAKSERPTLLFAFMAMVGLPAFLRADEKRAEPPSPPTPPLITSPSTPVPRPDPAVPPVISSSIPPTESAP